MPRPEVWVEVGIFVAVLAVYAPVLWFGFVNFDDPEYVAENGWVRRGLTWGGVEWAFTSFHAANWHPLTWLSHMLDCQVFGLWAGGHHVSSVLLHAAAALLLFVALRRMTGAVWRSGMVAALFALHPLRVESVAWISERKDVLSAFLWMVGLLAYARYAERPSRGRYLAVAAAFAAGLLAKPMAVTFPFALLLLDAWPLGRLSLDRRVPRPWLPVVIEKVPLLALAGALSVVVFRAQRAGGAVVSFAEHPLAARLANALLSYTAYLGMTIWPRDLIVFYPYRETFPLWQMVGAVLVLGTITVGAVWLRRRAPWVLVGWLWYVGTLVPVVGIIRAGDQAMADRFTYVPHVGLFLAVVWGLASVTARWSWRRSVLPAAAATALVGCIVGTRLQLRYWADSVALFGHALAVSPRNAAAQTNYGYALLERGQAAEALGHFEQAVAIRPSYAKARLNLGVGLASVGRSDEAIVQYREALRLDPTYVAVHYDLGLEFAEHDRLDEAIAAYREAIRLDPGDAKAENGLGLVLARAGRFEEAVGHYQAALAVEPGLSVVHNNLAIALERLERNDEALAQYREAVRLAPDEARAHANLAAVLGGSRRFAEAASEYQEALRLRPDLQEIHLSLGDVLLELAREADADAQYRLALAGRPGWAAAETRLAWALATGPDAPADGAEAVRLAEHARDETRGEDPDVLRSLAAAYAAAGRFPEAAAVGRQAAERARGAGRQALAAELEDHVAAYTAGQPIRRAN